MARHRGPSDPWSGESPFDPGIRELKFPRPPRRFWLGAGLIGGVLILVLLVKPLIDLATALSWYQALGLTPVFTTRLEIQWGLFVGGLVVAFLYSAGNLVLALRLRAGPAVRTLGIGGRGTLRTLPGLAVLGLSGIIALILGGAAASQWQALVLFTHQHQATSVDPVLHANVTFYLLGLPFLEAGANWAFGLTFLVGLAVLGVHVWRGESVDFRLTPRALAHLSANLALLALAMAVQTWLGRYDLLSAHNGFVWGAGFADVNGRLQIATISAGAMCLLALGLLVNVRLRRLWVPLVATAVWILLGLAAGIYPAIVQRLVVAPNELGQEAPYIQREIAGTRAAYGLNGVAVKNYPYQPQLTAAEVSNDAATIQNLRLWDGTRDPC